MTVSRYFRHTTATNEQSLVDDLVVEIIQQRGLDLMYIPREKTLESDYLFGEDPENDFGDGVTVEMMPNNMQGFEGEGDFMAGFGLDIRDEASFTISKTRFVQEVTGKNTHITRPREGDLIVFALAKAVFEITFVEHEKPFYTVGKGHTFDMSCKRFEYAHEEFGEVDDVTNTIPVFPDVDDSVKIQEEFDEIGNFDEEDPFSDNEY